MTVGIFIPVSEWKPGASDIQLRLLPKFLYALNHSDFPQDYTLLSTGPGQDLTPARDHYINKLAADHDFVISADADMTVPPVWWSFFEQIFKDEPSVGIIVPTLTGRGWKGPIQSTETQARFTTVIVNGQVSAYGHLYDEIKPIPNQFGEPDVMVCDGFLVMRSQMLREIPYNDNRQPWYLKCLNSGWRIVAERVASIEHDKGELHTPNAKMRGEV